VRDTLCAGRVGEVDDYTVRRVKQGGIQNRYFILLSIQITSIVSYDSLHRSAADINDKRTSCWTVT